MAKPTKLSLASTRRGIKKGTLLQIPAEQVHQRTGTPTTPTSETPPQSCGPPAETKPSAATAEQQQQQQQQHQQHQQQRPAPAQPIIPSATMHWTTAKLMPSTPPT